MWKRFKGGNPCVGYQAHPAETLARFAASQTPHHTLSLARNCGAMEQTWAWVDGEGTESKALLKGRSPTIPSQMYIPRFRPCPCSKPPHVLIRLQPP